MIFFPGLHRPAHSDNLPRVFVSVNVLWSRRSDFPVRDWIMDSGAFTEIASHGGYRPERSVEAYSKKVKRWRRCGRLLRAVAQDWMCEPHMIERTGGTVALHQRWTIERYDALIRLVPSDWIMPCLQGQEPADYVDHLAMYGDRLRDREWVGIGSVCKRKKDSDIREVIRAIRTVRPDLRLHGFGLKTTALRCAEVWDSLYSADSMAWSFAARYEGRDPNDWREAARFAHRIETMARQEVLL